MTHAPAWLLFHVLPHGKNAFHTVCPVSRVGFWGHCPVSTTSFPSSMLQPACPWDRRFSLHSSVCSLLSGDTITDSIWGSHGDSDS